MAAIDAFGPFDKNTKGGKRVPPVQTMRQHGLTIEACVKPPAVFWDRALGEPSMGYDFRVLPSFRS